MTRIVIDPAELASLSASCRNASYDVAAIAAEAQHRVAALAVPHANVGALVETAGAALRRVAAQLEDDALAVAQFGQRGADADALGGLAGNDHALLTRLTGAEEHTEP